VLHGFRWQRPSHRGTVTEGWPALITSAPLSTLQPSALLDRPCLASNATPPCAGPSMRTDPSPVSEHRLTVHSRVYLTELGLEYLLYSVPTGRSPSGTGRLRFRRLGSLHRHRSHNAGTGPFFPHTLTAYISHQTVLVKVPRLLGAGCYSGFTPRLLSSPRYPYIDAPWLGRGRLATLYSVVLEGLRHRSVELGRSCTVGLSDLSPRHEKDRLPTPEKVWKPVFRHFVGIRQNGSRPLLLFARKLG
jgi:hypothetical protein